MRLRGSVIAEDQTVNVFKPSPGPAIYDPFPASPAQALHFDATLRSNQSGSVRIAQLELSTAIETGSCLFVGSIVPVSM